MFRALEIIARHRIEAAIERGEFDDLAGAGRPQNFDDERFIPPEHRMAYRLMKNSGFAPVGVHLRRRIAHVEALIEERLGRGEAGEDIERLQAQLAALRTQLEVGKP